MRIVTQSLLLLLSFAFVFVWQNSTMSAYTIPLLGFLIFIYIILSALSKKPILLESGGIFTVILLNTAILLFIFSTQGLHSPLFFLLFFVLFGIAFVFEPLVVFIYLLLAIGLFVPQIVEGELYGNLAKIGAFVLISPLAFFFGKEYKQRTEEEEKTKKTAEKIEHDVQDVLQDQNLPPEDKAKLDDALQEAEKLTQ